MTKSKEQRLTECVQNLHGTIKSYLRQAPSFSGDDELARELGRSIAKIEVILHYEFGCWELGLPSTERQTDAANAKS